MYEFSTLHSAEFAKKNKDLGIFRPIEDSEYIASQCISKITKHVFKTKKLGLLVELCDHFF